MRLLIMGLVVVLLFMVGGVAQAQTYYRGGSRIEPTPKDYKIKDGLVQPERGVSLSTDKYKMQRFGGAYRTVSYPSSLKIIKQGQDSAHCEMPPAQPMKLEDYAAALQQVKLEREDW